MYQLDHSNQVKIWFTNNPASFMPLQNQLRLIDFRINNPNTNLTLVYASSLLNANALQELKSFANKVKINLFDFDNDLDKQKIIGNELHCYNVACEELDALKNDSSGCLAAASDAVRWLKQVIALGNYTDLDVAINLSGKPSAERINTPILFNVGSVLLNGYRLSNMREIEAPSLNNDTLLFARNPKTGELHKDAKKQVKSIYKVFKRNRAAPFTAFVKSLEENNLLKVAIDKIPSGITSQYDSMSFPQFRKAIKAYLTEGKIKELLGSKIQYEKQAKGLVDNLEVTLVTNLTGPYIISNLFLGIYGLTSNYGPMRTLYNSSIEGHKLQENYYSVNNVPFNTHEVELYERLLSQKSSGDNSWTTSGKKAMQQNDETLSQSPLSFFNKGTEETKQAAKFILESMNIKFM